MTNSTKDQDPQFSTNALPKPKRMRWFWYFIFALIIAIWTVWGALFFIAVVWVLRLNPSPEASPRIGNNEQKTARRIYTWLFLSPFLTIPIFIGMLFNAYNASANEYVLIALTPLLLHTPLLFGLTSNSTFVYRHTQQGIFLIALRAGMASLAAVNVEDNIGYALLLFFLGNGAIWLIGSMTGWSQISDGKCWFMQRRGETIISMDIKKIVAPESRTTQPNETDKKMEQLLNGMDAKEKEAAKEKSLEAFRSGIRGEVRKNAVNILSILGEVEKF